MMDTPKPELPAFSDKDRTPLVDALMELLAWQQKQIDKLQQEILKLKGETLKPDIKPSKMDNATSENEDTGNDSDSSKPKKGPKRSKTATLKIDATIIIEPDKIPEGAIAKGYRDVVIQDIKFETFNTCYRLAQYQTVDGSYVSGQLPDMYGGCHFGKNLIGFILYQYHHQHVTQPLLLKQLHDLGVDISSGRLSQFITDGLDVFHDEKDQLLQAGLSVSQYVHADDTGARHNGKNGYCTHIGNELFAWFGSTESKNRINFLGCLGQGKAANYVLNAGALEYMARQKLPPAVLTRIEDSAMTHSDSAALEAWLDGHGIKAPRHRKIITEGVLMGGLLAQGIPITLAIISDDAGQFNVFDHALCWIHAERIINRLIPLNDDHVKAVDVVREQLWSIYRDLKAYKLNPDPGQVEMLKTRFQAMCSTKTSYATLNQALKRMGKNQHELLRVLDRPELPLHNNLSENDIRDYVKKRKISGSTRSDAGRRCRDTFASLKKTCLKHGISFWRYLKDRLLEENTIPPLPDLIRATVTCG
ncbi:transposase [Crenothrix polyspora]|uniref:Transposase n=1 Tax=Crenothrix polyspora TaxID=360316 RepID=A0A1R4H3E6_9GAMM|nr:transposase [Crenothrix polyspora]SJM90775.1 transposase [Crenothrix polyspora]